MIAYELSFKKYLKHILSTLLICMLFAWYANYHWKRRRLYHMAAQRKGPPTLPFIGNALYFSGSTIEIFNNFVRLTKEFESPVRIWFGQKLFYVIWKPNDLEIVMNSNHALKKSAFYKFAEILSGNGLFTGSVPAWKQHKKIIMPAMYQRILDEYVEVFSEQSEILVEQLKKEAGKGIFDIFSYVSRCSVDIVCETAMGIKMNAQTSESDFMKWVNKFFEIMAIRMFDIFYHYDFIFNLTSLGREFTDVTSKINAFGSNVITEKKIAYLQRRKESLIRPSAKVEEDKNKHFLQLLIQMSEAGENLTDDDILHLVNNILIGGTDTTSSEEGFAFIMLGMFPKMQDKVYQEVIDVLGPDRPVLHTDLGKFPYLEMFIKETLRLFPIGQLISRDITNDIELESCTLPAGSSVIMFLTATHRDFEVWPNPLKFDPNRFLPEKVAKRHAYSWVPFLGGLRKCVGPRFAMMAMKVLIATVIRRYQFFTDYKSIEDVKLKLDLGLKPADGFRVSIKLRQEN